MKVVIFLSRQLKISSFHHKKEILQSATSDKKTLKKTKANYVINAEKYSATTYARP